MIVNVRGDGFGPIEVFDGEGPAGDNTVRTFRVDASKHHMEQIASLIRGAYQRGVNDEHARIIGIVEKVVDAQHRADAKIIGHDDFPKIEPFNAFAFEDACDADD